MAIEIINLTPGGVQTYGNGMIGYVKGGKLYLNSPELKIMVENEDQVAELSQKLPPGTRFFLPGSNKSWQTGSDGTPTQNEMIGSFYLDPESMNLYYNPEEG